MTDTNKPVADLTAKIVAAFVSHHEISHIGLPTLIKSVHNALTHARRPEATPVEEAVKPTAAQIRKSITPDALISFLDGKGYKTLKRHLTTNGLTIAAYKDRFGLPADYPTTAPSYSAARSALAKSLGLGQGGRKPPTAVAKAKAAGKKAEVAAPVKRGRAK